MAKLNVNQSKPFGVQVSHPKTMTTITTPAVIETRIKKDGTTTTVERKAKTINVKEFENSKEFIKLFFIVKNGIESTTPYRAMVIKKLSSQIDERNWGTSDSEKELYQRWAKNHPLVPCEDGMWEARHDAVKAEELGKLSSVFERRKDVRYTDFAKSERHKLAIKRSAITDFSAMERFKAKQAREITWAQRKAEIAAKQEAAKAERERKAALRIKK